MKFNDLQSPNALLNLDDYLAKVAAAFQELECFFGLGKRKYPVNYRVNPICLVETNHFFKPILGTVDNSSEYHRSTESQKVDIQAVLIGIYLARDIANAVDQSSESDAVKAFPQSFGTANFQDNINAVVLSDLHHFDFPIGVSAVVDSKIST